jgi:DNA-binding transcriptional MerR regulator
MIVSDYLHTVDLARAGQISVQQVRNYEAGGFIPQAERSAGGYRLYTQKHVAALKTARNLAAGYGWLRARAIMQAVHQGSLASALDLVDERHAELAAKRDQIERTLAALRALAAQSSRQAGRRHSYTQPLRIGQAAKQVGVRVSALHFWEQQGLLSPVREPGSRYRLYDEQQMVRLRVVAMLRETGYDFGAIRLALDELAAGHVERAIAAVEKKRAEQARISWACLVAVSSFREYVSEHWPELQASL